MMTPSKLQERRQATYKKTVTMEDMKRPREMATLQIRKDKQACNLAKRRAMPMVVAPDDHLDDNRHQQQFQNVPDPQLACVVEESLNLPEGPQAQNALNYLCENRRFDAVALSVLVDGLQSKQVFIQVRATLCLAQLASRDVELRDRIIANEKAMKALKNNIYCPTEVAFCFSCVYFIRSLLQHVVMPPIEITMEWTLFLTYVIVNIETDQSLEILIEASHAISCISNYPDVLFSNAIIKKLVKFLGHDDLELVVPALTTLGSITSKSHESTQDALDAGILHYMARLLRTESTQTLACSVLANIAAGNATQIQMLFGRSAKNIFRQIGDFALNKHYGLKREALSVITTVIKYGTPAQVRAISGDLCPSTVPALCDAIHPRLQVDMLKSILEALKKVLDARSTCNQNCRERLEQRGLVRKLEALLDYQDFDVSRLSCYILDVYFKAKEVADEFGYEEDVPQENYAPNVLPPKELYSSSGRATAASGLTSFGNVRRNT